MRTLTLGLCAFFILAGMSPWASAQPRHQATANNSEDVRYGGRQRGYVYGQAYPAYGYYGPYYDPYYHPYYAPYYYQPYYGPSVSFSFGF